MNRIAEGRAIAAAAPRSPCCVIVIWSVEPRRRRDQPRLLHEGPAAFGQSGGGIAPAIVGTFMLVVIATVIALPIGVLTAIYVSEFAPASATRSGSGSTC